MQNDTKTIASAILIAGVLIAGAILLRGSTPPSPANNGIPLVQAALAPVSAQDRTLGNANARVTFVMYEDFQCPWCGRFVSESEQVVRDNYVKNGSVQFVFRDFAFLGPESEGAAEAARCAGDQGQFWQYHDYLFAHQGRENQGAFSADNLKSFAEILGLDKGAFAKCLDSGKYAQAVADSKTAGESAGVTGTPKGFILKNGKIVDTIDGYLPLSAVKQKLDNALK